MDFGTRLKALRKKAGYTQQEVAELANVTKSVVSFYENKDRAPSPDVLKRLSNIFNVSTDYLLGIEKETPDIIDVSGLSREEIEAVKVIVNSMKGKQ